MIRSFTQSRNYVRMRATLGGFYIVLGLIILVRTCTPLSALSFSKLSPVVLGAAIVGLGVFRIRELLLMRKSVTS